MVISETQEQPLRESPAPPPVFAAAPRVMQHAGWRNQLCLNVVWGWQQRVSVTEGEITPDGPLSTSSTQNTFTYAAVTGRYRYKCQKSHSSWFLHFLAVWLWVSCPLWALFPHLQKSDNPVYLVVAVETKCASEGQGSGEVPASSRRSARPREALCRWCSFHFAGDTELTFSLHRTGTFFRFPHISSPLIHSPRSFEVHQAGGGLPVVKINRCKKVKKMS